MTKKRVPTRTVEDLMSFVNPNSQIYNIYEELLELRAQVKKFTALEFERLEKDDSP
jgi:hypothetical protein